MRAPFVRARKLEEDPSPLHWLTGFDTVYLRALVPFAHGRPAQKTTLSSPTIIKRTFGATFVAITLATVLIKITRQSYYFKHRVKVNLISLDSVTHFVTHCLFVY